MTTCLDCGAALTGRFCAACGQRDVDTHRPVLALAGELLAAAFNFESRAWRTLPLVLVAPGRIAQRYVAGQRARHVGPASVYTFVTFLFFVVLNLCDVGLLVLLPDADGGIGIVVSGDAASPGGEGPRVVSSGFSLQAFVPLARARERAARSAAAAADLAAAPDAATRARVEQLMTGVNELTANPDRTNALLEVWLPRLLVLLVPLFALVLKAVFIRQRVLLYDHLVFSLYLHASLFLLLTLLVVVAAATSALPSPLPLASVFIAAATALLGLALRHAYGGGFAATALRLVASLLGYTLIFTLALNAAVLYGLR